MRAKRALPVLILFVLAISGRDVVYDLWMRSFFGLRMPDGSLQDNGLVFATLACAAIVVLSALMVTLHSEWHHLASRLRDPRVLARSLVMGLFAGVIYGVTFSVIDHIGAGLFNLVDWGMAPAVTAALGYFLWHDRVRPLVLITVTALGVLGIVGLYRFGALGTSVGSAGLWILGLALLSPVCTAVSFSLQRWLLLEEKGGLSRQQVLLVRFAPAAVGLALYTAFAREGTFEVRTPALAVPIAALLGGVPAVVVCGALVRGALARFAAWQFAIPATTYLATLAHYPDNRSLPSIGFASLMLFSVLLMELIGEDREEATDDLSGQRGQLTPQRPPEAPMTAPDIGVVAAQEHQTSASASGPTPEGPDPTSTPPLA